MTRPTQRRAFAFMFSLALGIVPFTVFAQAPVDLQAFVAEQRAQRTQIEAGQGRYAELSQGRRQALLAEQDTLFALIGEHQRIEELSETDRLAALNAMSALQAESPSERRICKRVKRVGSHRSETICRTAAQMQEEQDRARRSIDAARSGCGIEAADAACGSNQP